MDTMCLKSIKCESIRSVFEQVSTFNKTTRLEVSERTGISLTTVGKVTDALIDMKILMQTKSPAASTAGRRAGLLSVDKSRYAAIFNLTTRDFLMSIVDLSLKTIEQLTYPYNYDFYFDENVVMFIRNSSVYLNRNTDISKCIGIGVAVAGFYDCATDIISSSPIPELNFIKPGQLITDTLHPDIVYIGSGLAAAALSAENDYKKEFGTVPSSVLYIKIAKNSIGSAYCSDTLRGKYVTSKIGGIGETVIGGKRFSELLMSLQPEAAAELVANSIYNAYLTSAPDLVILDCTLCTTSDVFEKMISNKLSALSGKSDIPIYICSVYSGCRYNKGIASILRDNWINKVIMSL